MRLDRLADIIVMMVVVVRWILEKIGCKRPRLETCADKKHMPPN